MCIRDSLFSGQGRGHVQRIIHGSDGPAFQPFRRQRAGAHDAEVHILSLIHISTEPMATRILMMTCWQENGMKVKEHLYFMPDALKNVTSIFDGQQTRRARYEYAPFGSLLTAKEDMAQENKFRFSCEYARCV